MSRFSGPTKRLRVVGLVAALAVSLLVMATFPSVASSQATGERGPTDSIWPDAACKPPPALLERARERPILRKNFAVIGGKELKADQEIRAVAIAPDQLHLYVNGVASGGLAIDASGPLPFGRLVELLDDPTWIADLGGGLYESRASIVVLSGASLELRRPDIRELRLLDRPGTVVGGLGGRFVADGVRITSWQLDKDHFDETLEDGRPYLLFERGSSVEITDSELIGLGSDRVRSYGFSVGGDSTTGSIRNSYVAHNFFGFYTNRIDGFTVDGNLFEFNVAYGVDPHTDSSGLEITNNVTRCNGRHGIIVSERVDNSTIANNLSWGNAVNGIVVDRDSSNVTVTRNVVRDNEGDGVVVADSASAAVIDNEINGNRIGIRLSLPRTDSTVVSDNDVVENDVGLEASEVTGSAELSDNRWRNNSETGMILAGERTRLTGDEISGSPTGLDVRSTVVADKVDIDSPGTAVLVRDGSLTLEYSNVIGLQRGVIALSGGRATVTRSTVDAPNPMGGAVEVITVTRDRVEAGFRMVTAGAAIVVGAVVASALHWLGRRERNPEVTW